MDDESTRSRGTHEHPENDSEMPTVGEWGPYLHWQSHARGGLGEVFTATESELNRTVAVKRLQDRFGDDEEIRQRFLLEAEITARLGHPGIVPVYRLFHDAQNRPCYAMRFVEGQTLGNAIAEYHRAPADALAFRRLLQAFLQTCQTVAYAHSRGVIHRDLKPHNIMLGKFGETLVVDWGLAKVVGRPEETRAVASGEETLVPSTGGSDETAMGSAVGTPAYMSPEQAAGRWNVIDHRSDVYGLGAVLYSLLTGKPPIEKGDWPEMQQRIQRGDFPPPRGARPDVPLALEAVCLRAMALRPDDRYPSATALASEVEHWLADEPVSAYREGPLARGRRWMRRHRTLVSTAAVLLMAAVVGLSLGAALLGYKNREIEVQRLSAVSAQRQAEAINRFLIDDLLRQADPVNNPVGKNLTVRELLDKASDKLDHQTNLADQPEVEAELRTVIGHAYEYLDDLDRAERQYRRAWKLQSQLRGPEDLATLSVRNRYLCALIAKGVMPGLDEQAREALDVCKRVLGPDHPETAEAMNNLAELLLDQGQAEESVALRREACRIAHSGGDRNASKALEYDNNLASSLVVAGHPAEGARILRSVVERRRALNPRHPELPRALANLGGTLLAMGQFAEAEPYLEEAIKEQGHVAGGDSATELSGRSLLGYSFEGQERWSEAEAVYKAVLTERRTLLGPTARDTQRSLAFLTRLYARQQKWREAAAPLAELMLAQKPAPARTPARLAEELAAAFEGTGDPVAAESLLKEAGGALQLRLWSGDWLLAEMDSRRGESLRRANRIEEAEPILVTAAEAATKAKGAPSWSAATADRRVIELYESWGKSAQAATWKERLAALRNGH